MLWYGMLACITLFSGSGHVGIEHHVVTCKQSKSCQIQYSLRVLLSVKLDRRRSSDELMCDLSGSDSVLRVLE